MSELFHQKNFDRPNIMMEAEDCILDRTKPKQKQCKTCIRISSTKLDSLRKM